jgi:endo-1,3(4)-beta-glucanase
VKSQEEEELRLIFNWHEASMSDIDNELPQPESNLPTNDPTDPIGDESLPDVELLMFALPHHQERMKKTLFSSNNVHGAGCMPTIHGIACPAVGGSWSLIEHLHRTNFTARNPIRPEMHSAVFEAVKEDLLFTLPRNYMVGAGDTYFSGKLLARLGRIIWIAHELGFRTSSDPELRLRFEQAVDHLQHGVEIWLNGSAESPFLYDKSWRGIMMCGCDYSYSKERKEGHCLNVFNTNNTFHSCPALVDMGHNFGAGFYNDHHYHFGYHIYAAAILGKVRWSWAKEFMEHVLLLIRDIANPSDDDIYFPTWRHKDWYLGFSWASGVVTIGRRPYPNGRNQESVSEAIAAYEAIALFGDMLQEGFRQETTELLLQINDMTALGKGSYLINSQMNQWTATVEENRVKEDNALRIRDIGRLLMATEIRSAKTYWHVQKPNTTNVARIYPDVYEPKVIGMIWSMLAQEQTWFGNEEWKSYGIQLLPITVASELRDNTEWVEEMLPVFQNSCDSDPGCLSEGWSVLIYTCMATIGKWQEAWAGMNSVPDEIFEHAGANGHSRSNTLWYIATR